MQKTSLLVLIVDRLGVIGEGLCRELIGLKSQVVYVSQKQPPLESRLSDDGLESIVFVPYVESVPTIPDYTYSHIFVIDDGVLVKEYLVEFFKKAEKDKTWIIFIISLSKVNGEIMKNLTLSKLIKVVIYGDIFDKNIYPSFIDSAIKFGRIELANEGLFKTYPVFLDDVVSGIVEVAFGQNSSSSIFYLFPKHPPTELSLARMIQKANPTVRIDFSETRVRHSGNPSDDGASRISQGDGGFWTSQNDKGGNGKYVLPDNYPLKKKIRELNIESLMERRFNKDSFSVNRNVKERRLFPFRTLFLALFLLLIMPFVFTLVFSLSGFAMLGYAKTAIEDGNLSDAQRLTNASRLFFNLGQKTSWPLLIQAKLIGQEKNLLPIIKKISLGQDLSLVATHALDASRILSQVFSGDSKNPKEDFTKGTNLLKNAAILFRQNEVEEGIPKDFLAKIKSMDGVIKIIENTTDVLPNLFGFDGKKIYLVVFQNNMELRPGGGFIGSYGLLTLDSGRIVDFTIHDVYDADGQLKGHVEPPYPIRRHLGVVHWYLRDSNFDVDFAKGASSSALLLNAELGKRVDGVIGIDVSFVKSILAAIGGVFVADYKETVTSSNLFKLTQSHAEKNFFPGSRQKKDFLRSLFNSMQLAISSNSSKKNISYLDIAKSLEDSIVQKHLLFAFNDKNLQDLFTVNRWSSALWDERHKSPSSIYDFLGINEANLGVNKANYFVKRELFHNVNIDDNTGNISETLKIEYENSSNAWPGGDYVNYLRVILPLGATISSISFDGVSESIVSAITSPAIYEAKNFVAPLGLEVERYDESGKTIYGFLVNIKAMESKVIEIKYVLPQKISLESQSFSYNLRIFKQPGTDAYPYSFSIIYPKNLRVIDGLSSFSDALSKDLDLNVSFAQR